MDMEQDDPNVIMKTAFETDSLPLKPDVGLPPVPHAGVPLPFLGLLPTIASISTLLLL